MKKRSLIFLSIIPLIASCSSSKPLSFVPYTPMKEAMDVNVDVDTELYYSRKDFKPIVTANGEYLNMREFLKDNRDNRTHALMDNKGEMKMLVLPIRFLDSPEEISLEDKTTYIKNAFFGDSSVTKLESVTSFYNKSSYGSLRLSGEVAPWFTLDIAGTNWNKKGSNQTEASRQMTMEAVHNYVNNGGDITQFDNNNDGYIDSLYVVYDYPYSAASNKKTSTDELYWAYVDFIKEKQGYIDEELPLANVYAWSSIYFGINNTQRVDASTYIHETGHMFGLQDYYNTGSRKVGCHYQPLGFFDMMDSNQGDHTSLSKYLLNWSSPKVIKKEGSITLSIFSETGDYLLLPIQYDDNPYGEYLTLEYFAPTKLNTPNGLKYQNTDENGDPIYFDDKPVIFEFPNVHGLKVYHIDARLAYYERSPIGASSKQICLVGDEEGHDLEDTIIDFAFTNEIKDVDIDRHNVLYHLLESDGRNTFRYDNLASNDTLWGYGDTFGYDTFMDLSDKCGYKFKVTALSTKDITITFSRF